MSTWAIVVAAGSGTRVGGDVPKQFLPVAGKRVLDWSLQAARSTCDHVVLVVPVDRVGDIEPMADVVVAGGDRRSESVRAGLAAVGGDAEIVVVHDAARPLASPALFAAVVDAVSQGADGAVPGIPLVDTVKKVADGVVQATIDRSGYVAAQTPQAFRVGILRSAHAGEPYATDDAAVVEAVGGRVVVVPGDVANVKITTDVDLETVERALSRADGIH